MKLTYAINAMKNDSLLIMVAGASSRMKKSLEKAQLSKTAFEIAKQQHKSLIPLGAAQRPMLYHLLKNAMDAGIREIYLITSESNQGFKEFVNTYQADFASLQFRFAIQYLPKGRTKAIGTADAVIQCLAQYPELLEQRFTVCNGDNLYSVSALLALREHREADHALIAYDRDALKFPDEKIARFALLVLSHEGYLNGIVEKPEPDTIGQYRDPRGKLRVSMNIYNFYGKTLLPFLESCPFHPVRDEKELPKAVATMAQTKQKSVLGTLRAEHVPDITNADDIKDFYL